MSQKANKDVQCWTALWERPRQRHGRALGVGWTRGSVRDWEKGARRLAQRYGVMLVRGRAFISLIKRSFVDQQSLLYQRNVQTLHELCI